VTRHLLIDLCGHPTRSPSTLGRPDPSRGVGSSLARWNAPSR